VLTGSDLPAVRMTRLTDAVEKGPVAIGLLLGKGVWASFRLASRPGRRTPRPDCHSTYAIDART
jgi:hypothetical protein